MTSYDDWKCDSGREDDGRYAPLEYAVTCVACSREIYVRADERPPYRCDRCCIEDEPGYGAGV